MTESPLPSFVGKFLFVHLTRQPTKDCHVIESPHCEEQADRIFLIGRVPTIEGVDLRPAGKITALAWDQVEHYQVFDSKEEVQEFFRGPTRIKPIIRERTPTFWDRLWRSGGKR